MTPAEMKKSCTNIIESYRSMGFATDKANVTMVTPKGFKPPPKFPRGYLLQIKPDGSRIWHYPATKVLAWVENQERAA